MKYTKDNPKLVENFYNYFEQKETFTGVVKDKYNNIYYYLNGKWHREDGPSIEWDDGDFSWYLNGILYGSNDDYTNESWMRFIELQLLK